MGPEVAVPALKKWVVAFRPWALPASSMPVIFGTSLAVVVGRADFRLGRFLLALAAMMILHTAANMLSDVFDFKRGLDTQPTPVSGALVRGWLSPRQVATVAVILFIGGGAIGFYLVSVTGKGLLLIGGVGVIIGLFYTALKYHALGDLAVLLNFGLLGSAGAWFVQAGSFSWIPVVWTIPMGMLVSAILHANNWRDSISDKEKRVTTVALILGDRGSLIYYGFLMFGSMAIIVLLVVVPRLVSWPAMAMPWTFLVVALALPRALALWGRARRRHAPRRPLDFVILDGATANYNLVFGWLCTAAVWLSLIVRLP